MCVASPIPEIEFFLVGVANPQSREGEAMGIVDGTIQKSVGDFLWSSMVTLPLSLPV